MRKSFYTVVLFAVATSVVLAQNSTAVLEVPVEPIPYYEIPDAPETYNPGDMVARMIDGLGYRYYWATEGLRSEDLAYLPGNDGRSAKETLDHIYGLSTTIKNAAMQAPNARPLRMPDVEFERLRIITLENIKMASDYFRGKKNVKANKMVFKRGDNSSDYPIWNLLNGPLADAIYHTGQIASYRRSSGNPVNPGMNVFIGKTKE